MTTFQSSCDYGNPIQISAFITKNFPAEIKFLTMLPAKEPVFLLSQHYRVSPCTLMLCKIYLSLNCRINIFAWNFFYPLMSQYADFSRSFKHLVLSDLRHQVEGWGYKISPFYCRYKSHIQAFRKYLFPPFCQLLKKPVYWLDYKVMKLTF